MHITQENIVKCAYTDIKDSVLFLLTKSVVWSATVIGIANFPSYFPFYQNKMRGKSGTSRASPAMGNATQMSSATQMSHNAVANSNTMVATAVTANAGTQVMQQSSMSPVPMSNASSVSTANKAITQSASVQAITSISQTK